MDRVSYSRAFLFTLDISNTEWTDYFYNKSTINTRPNEGFVTAAKYFYSNLGEALKTKFSSTPGYANEADFILACWAFSVDFITKQCNEPYPRYGGYGEKGDMLQSGESCMIFMPGYYYISKENEDFNTIITNLKAKMWPCLPSPASRLPETDHFSDENIIKWVKKVFHLRYGINLDLPGNQNYRQPAEYWFPCTYLLPTLKLDGSGLFDENDYVQIQRRNLWKGFRFNNGKQDRFINLKIGELNEPNQDRFINLRGGELNESNKVTYFVVHRIDDVDHPIKKISIFEGDYVQKNYSYDEVWHGHAYIFGDGEVITRVPYKVKARATKTERKKDADGGIYARYSHYEQAWGACIHVELDIIKNREPTNAQYESLAKLYYYFYKANNSKKLKILSHMELDRGIPDGHSDPGTDFSFKDLYGLLRNRYGIDIVPGIDGITEERHRASIENDSDMQQNWPPKLSGTIYHKDGKTTRSNWNNK